MKVLIIGGGPAGSTAAYHLAKHYDVTLIQNRIWDKPCGGGVKTKILNSLQIPKKLIKHQLDYVDMIYKNERIKIDLKGKNLSIVKREEFDSFLREKAQNAGAKLFYGKFTDFKDNRAIIKIGNEKIPFEYDILIAADGVNSTVRKALKLPKIPSTITHYARVESYKVKTCEFFFDFDIGGKYYAWAFPHETKTHIGSVSKENFSNLCKYLNVSVKPNGYHIPTWEENIIIQLNNIYFVGDAAGQVMPLSFEGIYYAIKSAEILSDSIIHNKDYQTQWNKRFLKEFKFMKFLESVNKTNLRGFVVKLHKLKSFQNFSINLWLGDKNV